MRYHQLLRAVGCRRVPHRSLLSHRRGSAGPRSLRNLSRNKVHGNIDDCGITLAAGRIRLMPS
jgi:hypothetical protein